MRKMDRPKVGLGVIVINNGKILLGKRKGSHGEGTWAFPGGHVEANEKFIETALRELEEETGLTKENIEIIDKNKLLPGTNDLFIDEDKHYITLYLRVKLLNSEPKIMEKDKCLEWKWFSWDDLPEPLFLPLKNLVKAGYKPFENF